MLVVCVPDVLRLPALRLVDMGPNRFCAGNCNDYCEPID
jgi:hypothetical protein